MKPAGVRHLERDLLVDRAFAVSAQLDSGKYFGRKDWRRAGPAASRVNSPSQGGDARRGRCRYIEPHVRSRSPVARNHELDRTIRFLPLGSLHATGSRLSRLQSPRPSGKRSSRDRYRRRVMRRGRCGAAARAGGKAGRQQRVADWRQVHYSPAEVGEESSARRWGLLLHTDMGSAKICQMTAV